MAKVNVPRAIHARAYENLAFGGMLRGGASFSTAFDFDVTNRFANRLHILRAPLYYDHSTCMHYDHSTCMYYDHSTCMHYDHSTCILLGP